LATYLLFRLGAWITPLLPLALAYRLAAAGAWIAYRMGGTVRAHVCSNLRRVLGPRATTAEIEATAQRALFHLACNYVDFFRIRATPVATLLQRVEVVHPELLLDPYRRGQGVVFTSAHLGNNDQSIQVASHFGVRIRVLVEAIRPERLFRFVVAQRESHGVRFVPVGPRALREAIAALHQGEAVAALADRDIQRHGMVLPFFGEPASFPTGPVELAVRTGAALVAGFCFREPGGRFRIEFLPEIALEREGRDRATLRRNMERLVNVLETNIRRAPDQWFVTEAIWDRPMNNAAGPDTAGAEER
jgi:KDO2-lipid IV(A) lauroyltransferase